MKSKEILKGGVFSYYKKKYDLINVKDSKELQDFLETLQLIYDKTKVPYEPFIMKYFIENYNMFQDQEELIEDLLRLRKNNKSLNFTKEKNINNLNNIIKDNKEQINIKSNRQKIKNIKTDDIVDVPVLEKFQDEIKKIIILLTEESSCKYGKGTKWCTSSRKRNEFGKYVYENDQILFIIIDHKNNKYKGAINEYKELVEFRDEKKNDILGYELFNEVVSYIIKFILKNYDDIRCKIDNKKIPSFIEKYKLTKNSDGTYSTNGDVEIKNDIIKDGKLLIKFKHVGGNFHCNHNNLISLVKCPEYVGGSFSCRNNKLTSLEGAPKKVGGSFYCNHNKLTSLKCSPKEVDRNFICNSNQLTTLEGCPEYVGGSFSCSYNNLISLEGYPEYVGGYFICNSNQLTSLEGCPEKVGKGFYCYNNNLSKKEIKRFRKEHDYEIIF